MKRILLVLMFASPLIATSLKTTLVRTTRGYSLHLDNIERRVNSYDIDARLRSMDGKQLGRLAAIGGLKAYQMSNGDYRVEIGGALKGGGPIGATIGAFIGKAAVSVIGHGAIAIVSGGIGLLCPPAGMAVAIALESTCGVAIETASLAGAVAGGIALGVATGPV